jgi:hypothetical protein
MSERDISAARQAQKLRVPTPGDRKGAEVETRSAPRQYLSSGRGAKLASLARLGHATTRDGKAFEIRRAA